MADLEQSSSKIIFKSRFRLKTLATWLVKLVGKQKNDFSFHSMKRAKVERCERLVWARGERSAWRWVYSNAPDAPNCYYIDLKTAALNELTLPPLFAYSEVLRTRLHAQCSNTRPHVAHVSTVLVLKSVRASSP